MPELDDAVLLDEGGNRPLRRDAERDLPILQ